MKKYSVIIALILLFALALPAQAGILPGSQQIFGHYLPSLSYVLRCLPDITEELPDGGSKVTYMNVTEADYDAFSTYLGDYGCTLLDYAEGDNGLCFTLEKEGCSFTFEYSNISGIAVLTYPAGYTEDLTWAQEIYDEAMTALDEKDYLAAAAALEQIKGYKDVDSILADCENDIAAAAAREPFTKVGNIVTYGHYEQDNNTGNGKEPIEWLVLDVQGDKVFLVSRYNLDVQPYNESYDSVTWDKCTLRTWLNNDFLNSAFTATEQRAILTTNVDNSSSQGYSGWNTSGGNNTRDKVFLLSYAEVWKYFTSDSARKCNSTAYVASRNSIMSKAGNSDWWWLRSPGSSSSSAAFVNNYGARSRSYVHSAYIAVRPAFWLDLSGI